MENIKNLPNHQPNDSRWIHDDLLWIYGGCLLPGLNGDHGTADLQLPVLATTSWLQPFAGKMGVNHQKSSLNRMGLYVQLKNVQGTRLCMS